MKPRFQPDSGASVSPELPSELIDPDAYDAAEEQFAASLEETGRPSFVVDDAHPAEQAGVTATSEVDAPSQGIPGESTPGVETSASPVRPETEEWRQELSARVHRFRNRRQPRTPRYPSLQLKFESSEPSWSIQSGTSPPAAAASMQDVREAHEPAASPPPADVPAPQRTKILEFPSPPSYPTVRMDELAEPVLDRPRILDVPEVLPPPPALGGILIEPAQKPADERRPGFELPLQGAAMPRRALASAIDALIVGLAFAAFAYTFFRITAVIPPLGQAAGASAALVAVFWAAYQYLLLVYAGTTPGLRLARLRLSRFDGSPVPRGLRRWRVLASILSGVSLAMGYAWCFLDEDELCWHDRITRTYMAPK